MTGDGGARAQEPQVSTWDRAEEVLRPWSEAVKVMPPTGKSVRAEEVRNAISLFSWPEGQEFVKVPMVWHWDNDGGDSHPRAYKAFSEKGVVYCPLGWVMPENLQGSGPHSIAVTPLFISPNVEGETTHFTIKDREAEYRLPLSVEAKCRIVASTLARKVAYEASQKILSDILAGFGITIADVDLEGEGPHYTLMGRMDAVESVPTREKRR